MGYKIRRVNANSYAEEIERIQRLTLPNDKPKPAKPGEWWWLVFAPTGEVVGFASLTPSVRYADCSYLSRVGVDPAHRGHGLQRKLIRARCAKAKAEGHSWVFSDTRQNPISANNLIACGFTSFAPKKPWGFVSGTYWRKKL